MRHNYSAIALGLWLGLLAGQARAFDLTGTWEGKVTCKRTTSSGQTTITTTADTLTITQSATDVRLEDARFATPILYSGRPFAFTDDPDTGALGFRSCGLSENPAAAGEMGNAKVSTKPSTGAGQFAATSILSDDDGVETCKWKFTRTSAIDPGVAPCP